LLDHVRKPNRVGNYAVLLSQVLGLGQALKACLHTLKFPRIAMLFNRLSVPIEASWALKEPGSPQYRRSHSPDPNYDD